MATTRDPAERPAKSPRSTTRSSTTLTLSSRSAAAVSADAVVVGVARGSSGPRLLGSALPAPLERRLRAALGPLGVSGAADEVVRVPSDGAIKAPVVVLTGLGALDSGRRSPEPEALRRAAGAATRTLTGTASVAIALPVDDAAALAAVTEGALFGAYAFTRYRSRIGGEPAKAPVRTITVLTDSARSREVQSAARRAQVLAEAVHITRDLVTLRRPTSIRRPSPSSPSRRWPACRSRSPFSTRRSCSAAATAA